MRKPLVMGNWKMNGGLSLVKEIAETFHDAKPSAVEVGVCPPAPFITAVKQALQGTGVLCGAQNVSEHEKGAYTGELSVEMLKEVGCDLVLVGHSERRTLYGETDELIAQKVVAVAEKGLVAVLCVGETQAEREQGKVAEVISRQIDIVLKKAVNITANSLVIAYEPVWAIGTGLTATPEQVQEVHAMIREQLTKFNVPLANSVRIVYGGSVKSSNAAELFTLPDVDGGLIGGASLNGVEFLKITQAAISKKS